MEADLVISLGGDGTLLALARHAGPVGTPLLGLDFGSFGFLARESYEVLMANLPDVLEGQYSVESRLMVEADVVRGSEVISTRYGLNDAVIAKTDVRHLVWLDTYVNDEHVATYPADGLIISTPTGSTAYALAVGGPILPPELKNILVAPVAPHLSMDRPMVLSQGATVEVIVVAPPAAAEVVLTVDGELLGSMKASDQVVIAASDSVSRFVRLRERTYF